MAVCNLHRPLLSHPLFFAFNFATFALLAFNLDLTLPFSRSLVACAALSSAKKNGADDGSLFTGSAHCADRLHVIGEGQQVFSAALMVKLLCRTIAGPILGALADRFGRRPVFLLGIGGLFSAIALAALAAYIGTGVLAVMLFVASSAIQGITSIFAALFLAMAADLTRGKETEQPAIYSALSVVQGFAGSCGLLAAVGIERLNLSDYLPLWCILTVLLFLLLLVAGRFWDETLSEETFCKEADGGGLCKRSLNAVKEYEPLLNDGFLRTILVAVVLLVAGLTSGSLLSSFTMAAYGWRQGDLQIWMMPLGAASMVVVGMSDHCVARFGVAHVVVATTMLLCFNIGMQILAPLPVPVGPCILLLSLTSGVFVGPLVPSFNTSIARRYDIEKQAKAHCLIGAAYNVSAALATPFYAWLFDPKTQSYTRMASPFIFGWLLLLGGTALIVRAYWQLLLEERPSQLKYAQFDDSSGFQAQVYMAL